jgi:hypothetical protein
MKYKTVSHEYETIRLTWPNWLPQKCPFCDSPIQHLYADNGKKIHTLDGIIYQITNYYSCTSSVCPSNQKPFNPHMRFDYGSREYGADIFRFIAEEFLLFEASIKGIHKKLTHKYNIKISERTVARICDDILNLKAYRIDENTKAMFQEYPQILLGFDGQDPGKDGKALWLFMDLLTGRVLHTVILDGIDYSKLHGIIEEVLENYNASVIGFVSDKQNTIVKCCNTFYPDIPHQYCQFHFLNNAWNQMECLDSNLFLPIKKTLSKLYIHVADPTVKVFFEGKGKFPVKEVFAGMDQDFQIMIKARNKKFRHLRGVWIYETLQKSCKEMKKYLKQMDPEFRFTKIFSKTIRKINEVLKQSKTLYTEVKHLATSFEEIRGNFEDPTCQWLSQQVTLDDIYRELWGQAVSKGLPSDLVDLRAFLPSKSRSYVEILGEWCRLWESYRPGLFQYQNFPKPIKTNNGCENAFSQEKQKLIRRVAKMKVGHLIGTRGESYLRLSHCTQEELESDIVQEYSQAIIYNLQIQQQQKISAITQYWRRKDKDYRGFTGDVIDFFPFYLEEVES